MHRLLYLFTCLIALALVPQARAQQATQEPLSIGPSGEAYIQAVRRRGIDTDVAYFDPTAPAPRLETDQEPDRTPAERRSAGDLIVNPSVMGIVAAVILIVILFFFFRFGGNMSVSLKGDAQNLARTPKSARRKQQGIASLPNDLAAILSIQDRRQALVLLAQSALSRAITANGLLLQRSWTARDALRRLPREQQHLDALSDLVAAGERVHFGGRDVPEEMFRDHVARIKPLFRGVRNG